MPWSIEAVREADVSPAEVFRYYTDPSTWPRWGHNTRWAKIDGPYVEGATVHVRAGYEKVWPVTVLRVDPDHLVVNEVRPVGLVVINTFEVTPSATGSRLRHAIDVDGRFHRFYRLFLPPLYRRLLQKECRRLVEAIEHDRVRAGATAAAG